MWNVVYFNIIFLIRLSVKVIVYNLCDFKLFLFWVYVVGEMNVNLFLMIGKSVVCFIECVGVFYSICDRGIFFKSLVVVKMVVCLLLVL